VEVKEVYSSRSCIESRSGLLFEVSSCSVHDGLHFHLVAWVSDHDSKILLQTFLSEAEVAVHVGPELGLWVSGSVQIDWICVHANSLHNSISGEETFIFGESWSESGLGIDVVGNGQLSSLGSEEFAGSSHILIADFSGFNSGLGSILESMSLVSPPESLEMSLSVHLLLDLMWVDNSILLDDLWDHFCEGIILSLEQISSLLGGGVHTKEQWNVLVGLGEGVEFLFLIIGVTTSSNPEWLWDLIVEESGGSTLTELLETEPFKWVWLLSLTKEWLWGDLCIEIVHGLIPGLSGVGIELPAVHFVGLGPLWYLESLVESSGSSIEVDISDSLEEGLWMEVLGVKMPHEVWLLVELLAIKVFDSNTDFS